jgi:lipopolysaccharide/colanic/teichoic acid biosynthesis glycosyltransferase
MIKRLFDLFFSFLGIIFLSPVLLLVSCLVKLDSNGPIFFLQERVGLNGKVFLIHKFRTMHVFSEQKGSLTVGQDVRITQIGRFLRKYKIDELPQLLDVFNGKMSFVGPRPEIQEFIDIYTLNVKNKVLSVKPGITDMASIEMVDENDILGKFEDPKQAYINIILPIKQRHYLYYVDNQSIWFDFKIIILTIFKIIKI